ncbi:MAG: prepilin-type N-terminal cleavage/methylation domain-containing protein [Candidatus Berkelbacteria bacterium]|nr:prepilin-type N-terminal cleavage/methylation domain-containing protein [Candidatus Berkelbacteria bacterium]
MKKRAFTLIELLIVIAIIAILATIIFISLASAKKKAQNTKIKADISGMSTALEIARSDSGSGSAIYTTTGTSWPNVGSGYDMTALKDESGKVLISANPMHPLSGVYYQVKVSLDNSAILAPLAATDGNYDWWCGKNGTTFGIDSTASGIGMARYNPASPTLPSTLLLAACAGF